MVTHGLLQLEDRLAFLAREPLKATPKQCARAFGHEGLREEGPSRSWPNKVLQVLHLGDQRIREATGPSSMPRSMRALDGSWAAASQTFRKQATLPRSQA